MTDPLEIEEQFSTWRKICKEYFFDGNVIELKFGSRAGTKGIVVTKQAIILDEKRRETFYDKTFVLFEDGSRETPNMVLFNNSKSVYDLSNILDDILEIESTIQDPMVPDKKHRFFSL